MSQKKIIKYKFGNYNQLNIEVYCSSIMTLMRIITFLRYKNKKRITFSVDEGYFNRHVQEWTQISHLMSICLSYLSHLSRQPRCAREWHLNAVVGEMRWKLRGTMMSDESTRSFLIRRVWENRRWKSTSWKTGCIGVADGKPRKTENHPKRDNYKWAC